MKRGAKFGVIVAVAIMMALPVLIPAKAVESGENMVPIKVSISNPVGTSIREVGIAQKDAIRIVNQIQSSEDAFKVLINPDSNESQKTWAMQVVDKIITQLKELGILPESFVFSIPKFLNPNIAFLVPVISIGSGFSYIPFYPGEAFIGFMFRPIFLQYFLFGYTASINFNLIPPRLEYWDLVGTQTAMILGFTGIYIDFGKIGYGIPNMQFMLGESLFVTGVDWL